VVLASGAIRHVCFDCHAVPNTDANCDLNPLTNSDGYINAHCHSYPYGHLNTNAYGDAHANANRDQHAYPESDADLHPDTIAHSDASSYAAPRFANA
jgi:hypothetical protein